MRIDDTDPDELDDLDLDRGPSRRTWLIVGGSVLVIGGLVAGFMLLRNDDDVAAPPSTVAVVVPDTEVDDTVPIDVGPQQPSDFPDFGSDYMGDKLEMLYQRVTDTGIRVVVHDNGNWGGNFEGDVVAEPLGFAPPTTVPGVAGWVPAPWCFAVGGIRVAMTYKDAIGISNGSQYAETRESGLLLTMFSSGYAEAQRFRVLVLQVAADVTLATASWVDGSVDSAAPANGWVVLATPGDSSVEFDISLANAAGVTNVVYDELPRDGDREWQKACNPPPPELPDAGEQPDDPAAAEQQIVDVFALLWNRDIPLDEKLVLDDTTGVADAVEQVDNGGFAETAKTATHTITELVFTSPTEAWFRYDIETNITNFTDRFGIAYQIDGVWVIARAVICQDLALAGAQCFPFVQEIRPPGSDGPVGGGPVPITIEPAPPSD